MAVAMKNNNSRYRSLILSIAVFLALIGVLLAFTFYTSSVLERNTALVNVSNKTANNAQAVIKDLFDLQSSVGEHINSPHQKRVRERLAANANDIDQLLSGMDSGADYVEGHAQNIPKINTETGLAQLKEVQNDWNRLKPRIEAYLEGADDIRVDSSDELSLAYEQAKTSSLRMNDALNSLTKEVYEDTKQQANTIRLIQILGVAAILAYFIIFVFFFVRRLRESDAEALEARRETQEIMQTVNTGLFLLDKDLNIGQQHSKALSNILGTERLAGENFTNVLRGRLSEKDLSTTRQFIEQLYNPRVKEKLVDDLNPLHKVMLHNNSPEQVSDNRYLDFKFSRVYEGKDIARILVNVNDVSDAVRLEQRLEQERAQSDMQIEMLATILNVEPKIINDFIVNTKLHIDRMNNILKNPGSNQFELESKLNSIYREMHSLKGEASALKLHSFTKIASDAEDQLHGMQNQGKLSGNDFLPLAVHLDELLNLSNTIETLGERINQSSPAAAASRQSGVATRSANATEQFASNRSASSALHSSAVSTNEEDASLTKYYQEFAQQIADRQQKQVQLETKGLKSSIIPDSLSQVVKEISIQLLRNAIVHGIETPAEREAAGKSATGHIQLTVENIDQSLVMTLNDDGQGIDYETIRARLVALERYSQEQANDLNQDQLLSELFSSGFTTRQSADEDGGRGVGLDIIKERVQEHQGHLNVSSDQGKMTRFVITLPLQ